MGDTKRGRERQGHKKREQLRERLVREELDSRDADEELPEFTPRESDTLIDPDGAAGS